MKTKAGLVIHKIAGQSMLVATGEAQGVVRGVIKLNDTAAVIWEELAAGRSMEDSAARLVRIYGISEDQARADVAQLVAQMKQAGLIED